MDLQKFLTDKLKQSRGRNYYAVLAQLAGLIKDDFTRDAKTLRDSHPKHKLTVFHIGMLSRRYELNFSAVCRLLEEFVGAPSGIYDRLKEDHGLIVHKVMEAIENDARLFEMPFPFESRYAERDV